MSAADRSSPTRGIDESQGSCHRAPPARRALGIVKLLPFKAHLAIDALGALAVAATPFVTGQWRKGRKHWAPHMALSVFEMCSLALTDPTGKGDFHGDIEGVRRANMENPHRKTYEGGPAVRRPTAAAA
jgi:hypothetical protein